MSPTLRQPRIWIGFDLGHGESAVALARADHDHANVLEILPGTKSIITAIAEREDKPPLLGRQALQSELAATRVKMHFKGSPLGRPDESTEDTADRNTSIVSFTKAVFDALRARRALDDDEHFTIIVGCPSSWTLDRRGPLGAERGARAEYQRLLNSAGIGTVEVIPESRAAFMEACESGRFTPAELKEAVLVIDIGSSTTDFTVVIHQQETPRDFGHPSLGAGLIDESIYRRAVAAVTPEAQAAIARHEPMRWGLMLKCRQAKEDFFRDEEHATPPGPVVKLFYDHQDFEFRTRLDAAAMAQILDEPQPALGGLGWRAAFAQSLKDARAFFDASPTPLRAVLLTGGPSRMKFVRDMTADAFASAKVKLDSSPEHTIAKGLALVGARDALIDAFAAEVDRFCQRDALGQMLEASLPKLLDQLVPRLARGVMDHAIKPAVRDWYDGRIDTLADLDDSTDTAGTRTPGAIGTRADQWLTGPEGQAATAAAFVQWLGDLAPDVQSSIDQICRRHKIPTGAVHLEIPTVTEVVDTIKSGGLSPEVVQLDFLHRIVTVVLAVFAAKLAGGGGIALIAAGPLGLAAGGGIAILAMIFGKSAITRFLKERNMPTTLRKALFLTSNCEDKCEEALPKIERTMHERLTAAWTTNSTNSTQASKEPSNQIVENARAMIRDDLLRRAHQAKLHIGSGSMR